MYIYERERKRQRQKKKERERAHSRKYFVSREKQLSTKICIKGKDTGWIWRDILNIGLITQVSFQLIPSALVPQP